MTVTVDPTPEPLDTGLGRIQTTWERFSGWVNGLPEPLAIGTFLLFLIAVSLFARTRTLDAGYWMDEGITVGIASHSLSAIPGIMRMDGSPPLFYMLLHVWMSLFGQSEVSTHWLSVIIGTITIPVGYWEARVLIGKRAAIYAAALFATNAFITGYSDETRMYVLMVLFAQFGTLGFIKGFVYRERRYVVMFAVAEALMLYTHSWGLFFGAASVACLLILWRITDADGRVNFIRDALYAYIGVAILYVPWVNNFIFQATHTAAPWDSRPRLGLFIQIAQGIMGGNSIAVICLVFGIVGAWGLFSRERRLSREAQVLYMLVGLALFTYVFGWIASQITPAWVVRYFAPTVPAVLLAFSLGLARARILGLLAVIVACTAILHPGQYAPMYKSNVRDLAGELAPMLKPGDLVLVGQPEQTPLAHFYLPAGLRFANTQAGLVKDPTFTDWVDAMKRYEAATPRKVLMPLLNSVKVGQDVLYIKPLTEGNADWIAPWTQMVRLRSAQWGQILQNDKQFVPIAWAPHDYQQVLTVADSAVLYKKVS